MNDEDKFYDVLVPLGDMPSGERYFHLAHCDNPFDALSVALDKLATVTGRAAIVMDNTGQAVLFQKVLTYESPLGFIVTSVILKLPYPLKEKE